MPLNVMDAHFRSFEKLVLPVLVQQAIGVLGMKSMANGIILKSKTATPVEFSLCPQPPYVGRYYGHR